ncbi:MAG: TRAP transporter substrate-binding protein DctP [Spirochaetaceae bacterium]|jgi:TRAP-type C4-dicarboxylate transport system substrate-binding protein|nr:TRAP transporter substrate-binding protein DctP [Spirochaetaceae bacterium]
MAVKKKMVLFVLAAALLGVRAYAQRPPRQIVIKLASMVPENTQWGQALNKLAAEWSRVSNGEVRLQVYANGTQGSEDAVLQKLNMNTIQAAVLTSFGLNKIAPDILTLSCPFLIRNDAELTEVLKTVKKDFEAQINSQNYFSLALIRGGWIKFFSREPVFVPVDLKNQKVGSIPSEPELAQAFRIMGYQVVMVDQNRLLIALRGGSIDAVYQSPIAAAGFQYFGAAKNMASINIAPFMAGIVFNKHAWQSIPDRYKNELVRVTQRIGGEIENSLLKLENDAIRQMKNYGLVENQISSRQQQEWYNDMTRAIPNLLGNTFNRAMYTKIDGILRSYRGRQ